MKVFVVSLENAVDRRSEIEAGLKHFNIEYEIFPAALGKEVDRRDPKIFNEETYTIRNNLFSKVLMKGKLNNGELGCALSHLKLYQKIVRDNLPGAIVLEDDFEVCNNFPKIFSKILKIIHDADIINGRTDPKRGLRQCWFTIKRHVIVDGQKFSFYKAGVPGLNWLLNRRRRAESSRCYYISNHACSRLIKLGFPVRMESDRLIGMVAFNKLDYYIIDPYITGQESKFGSLIATEEQRQQKAY